MEVSWDDEKDDEHLEKRGVGFSYVSQLLTNRHAVYVHPDYPHQQRAIGILDDQYWTLATEYHEDELGELIWCSNFWESTKKEKEYARDEGIL